VSEYLKLPEVARRLDVSEQTARRYIKSGALPSVFIGGAYRVSEEDLEAFVEAAKVTSGGGSPKAQAPPPDFEGGRRSGLSWEAARSHARMGATMAAVWGPELDDRVEAGDLEWMMRVGTIVADYGVVLNELLQNVTLPDKETAEEVAFLAMDLNAFYARVQEALPRTKEAAQRTRAETKEKTPH
jgi:excisionase family DNA binding protein